MILHTSLASAIWFQLKEKLQHDPVITVDQIQAISYRFIQPALELLKETLGDDTRHSDLILHDITVLLSNDIEEASRNFLLSQSNKKHFIDPCLKEKIIAILKRYLSQEQSIWNAILDGIYPIIHILLHRYRLNKNPSGLELKQSSQIVKSFTGMETPSYLEHSIRQMTNAMLQGVHALNLSPILLEIGDGRLSEKFRPNNNPFSNTDPCVNSEEIEFVTVYCLKLQAQHQQLDRISGQTENIEKTLGQLLSESTRKGLPVLLLDFLGQRTDASPDLISDDGTPLVGIASDIGSIETLKVLVQHGSNLKLKNAKGESALYLAAKKGHTSTVEWLVEQPGMIDEINEGASDGMTPLMIATLQGHAATVKLLLQKGANPSSQDHCRFCARDYAEVIENAGIIQLLRTPKDELETFNLLYYKRTKKLLHPTQQVESLNKKGLEAFAKGRFDEAVSSFKEVVKHWESVDKTKNPESNNKLLSALYNLGSAELKSNAFEAAEAHLKRACSIAQSISSVNIEKYQKRLDDCQKAYPTSEETMRPKHSRI